MNQSDIVRIIVGASVGMHGIIEIQITESGAQYIIRSDTHGTQGQGELLSGYR